ncbi:glycoside hydrolase [Marinilongibacter aquaticus]|uniref:sialidase family protein n=1 Tax=Marinilongibacter aquaticus TaxID=2975157 RepID=UPI0021BDE5F4|nr:sialidase family protein [Marinilongibacter aquaticus]UBM58675.1 glycoside hydrolase [Marinilongibacter aquaticus]
MKTLRFILAMCVLALFSCKEEKNTNQAQALWTQGEGRYNNYRIPSILVASNGDLLAFCEGREAGDAGNIDLLLKRSTDQGRTWSAEEVVWDDEANTCGNPCPVLDEETGRIWLFMTWNLGEDHESEIIHKTSKMPRLPFSCYSDDNGKTWSTPLKMGEVCRDSTWGWYATGPGFGIQIKNGLFKGRLVIPANHSYDDPEGKIRNGPYGYGAHVLFSDDHGETWERSEAIVPGCNESQVTELADGTLLMNMRSYNNQFARAVSFSEDGGKTWTEIEHDYQLVESKCQASILNFGTYNGESMHLFLNPAVPLGRSHMSLKSSFDNCASWSNDKLIYAGPSAYSCLAQLQDGQVGVLFEAGKESAYEKIVFTSFVPDQLFTAGTLLNEDSFE